jgi:hypothetical protein
MRQSLEAVCDKVVKLGSSFLCSYSTTTLLEVLFFIELQRYEVNIIIQSVNPQDLVNLLDRLGSLLKEKGYPLVLRMA